MMQTPPRRRKAYIETYGCQMNVADGELMQGVLAAGGYDLVAAPEDADVILVNTCAIREHAEQRVLGRVSDLYRLKQRRPDIVIGVTGCMAQRMGETLLERAPYVDLVMGPDGYRGLAAALARLRPEPALVRTPVAASAQIHGGHAPQSGYAGVSRARMSLPVIAGPARAALVSGESAGATNGIHDVDTDAQTSHATRMAVLEFSADENYEELEVRRASRVSAWVPVQRGCNYRCTYCIVPYVRGSEKNRDPERILAEVRSIAAQGITEVVLLGQTVNSYEHGEWRFPRLLREVARVDGVRRVRFTSPHPNDFTPELIEVMATEPHVCKQLHLPVQAGHDRTLKRMLRRYTVAEYLEKLHMARAAIPDLALSTDVIVAFPGEAEAEYEATLELMRAVRYDDAFLYKYSEREGTPATRLPREQFVPAAVAQRRLERLIELHRSIQAEINAAEVGREVEVLVEREARYAGEMLGRTDSYKVAAFRGDASLLGRYVRVRLTGTTGATFQAVRVDEPGAVERVA